MAIFEINLLGPRKEFLKGIIRPVDPLPDTLSWIDHWYPAKFDLSGHALFADSRWHVDQVFMDISQQDDFRVLVLEANDLIQGFIAFKVKNFRGLDNKPCVYVELLATAPWNRKTPEGPGNYRGVGSLLGSVQNFSHFR